MLEVLMKAATILATTFGLALAFGPTLTLADAGGGSSSGGANATCPRGQVWDSRSQRCVSQRGSALPDKVLTDYAYALAKATRYDEALETLDLLRDPNTAEALNYRGYATRKLGRVDEGIGYYLKSVAKDPRYAEVREYLGEAYVIKGDIIAAKEQLRTIEGICGTHCEQYQHLADAIADPSKL
jgi:tetratricopeptide (TPR) repeat protein